MNRVLVVFSDGLLSELDSARGLVSRSAWIRQAVEDKLMKEAVAPLVPEAPKRVWKGTAAEWAAFQEGAGFETPEETEILDRMHGITSEATVGEIADALEAEKAKPKTPVDVQMRDRHITPGGVEVSNRSRLTDEEWDTFRKRAGIVVSHAGTNSYTDALDRAGVPKNAPKPRARRKRAKELESETLKAMESVEKIISPQRCNRGACTGTILPTGRCIRCNQEPLKESK